MWVYSGLYVTGRYLGDIPVRGRVESSRVNYDGIVRHTVVLDEPLKVYGNLRDRVILDMYEIEHVMSNEEIV
jgi:hypothetical protein